MECAAMKREWKKERKFGKKHADHAKPDISI